MKVVILAGGSGSRLWPLSRSSHPKQFLTFGVGGSLLQKTVNRFLPEIPIQDLLIVTNQEYIHIVHDQLAALHPELSGQVILEPMRKNTATAITFSVRYMEENLGLGSDEAVLICPADQVVAPKDRFLETIQQAVLFAEAGQIVTFGVRPTRPETGYGYIKAEMSGKQPYTIEEFIEKPPLEQASAYVESGKHVWNAGLFLFTAETLWQECHAYASPYARLQTQSLAEIEQTFSELPSLSFDYAIMEKTKRACVMLLDLTWSDVGSWDSVHEVLDKDNQQNVTIGNVHAIDTQDSLIVAGKRLVTTLGIQEMLVVDTPDALFIAKKGESQGVKQLVEALQLKGMKEIIDHVQVHRPWGSYTVLGEGTRYKLKRIEVHPGARLSLQLHYHRSEHWIIVQGTAKVTIGEKEELLHENESVYVPKSAIHRLENPGKMPLEMIEVQVGEYVGEDDIVRLEDVYGRIPTSR